MSNAPDDLPFKARVGERIVPCRSIEDRNLLHEANAIAEDPTAAASLAIGRLHLIKDACQLYSLGKHQRLVQMAIDRRNAGGARSAASQVASVIAFSEARRRGRGDSVRPFRRKVSVATCWKVS